MGLLSVPMTRYEVHIACCFRQRLGAIPVALGVIFFLTTERQRCWNHRTLNLHSKLPMLLQEEARLR